MLRRGMAQACAVTTGCLHYVVGDKAGPGQNLQLATQGVWSRGGWGVEGQERG